MKFKKIEKLPLRNEIISHFMQYINCNLNYNLYFGIINDVFFSILLSEKNNIFNINSIINIDNIIKNNVIDNINHIYLNTNIYIRYPITLDFIDWIKAYYKIFIETSDEYNRLSLPYINSILEKNTRWINDILFKRSEKNLLLYRNNDFIICKDIIWKSNQSYDFYILAIPIINLKTIRDLRHEHLPLLKAIKNKIIEIATGYKLNPDNLYMFFHYHPSYYHIHLHACVIDHPILETKYYRNYLLDDVISCLEINSNYWKDATLKFELLSTSKLFKILESK